MAVLCWQLESILTAQAVQALDGEKADREDRGRGKNRMDQTLTRQSNLQLFRAAWSLFESRTEEKVSGDHSLISGTRQRLFQQGINQINILA